MLDSLFVQSEPSHRGRLVVDAFHLFQSFCSFLSVSVLLRICQIGKHFLCLFALTPRQNLIDVFPAITDTKANRIRHFDSRGRQLFHVFKLTLFPAVLRNIRNAEQMLFSIFCFGIVFFVARPSFFKRLYDFIFTQECVVYEHRNVPCKIPICHLFYYIASKQA